MEVLTKKEQENIEFIFTKNQKHLKKLLEAYLKMKYEKVISTEKYLIALGDFPVGVVAHLDTVFEKPPYNIFYDKEKNIMWSPEGLGADDRAGIYSILQIVKKDYKPTVIFTTDEEIGGIGAFELAHDQKCPKGLKYLIELDRRGKSDCVFYDCNNIDFKEYIESFGFTTKEGIYSDISELAPEWGIAGVNLSVGYYNEHGKNEYLNISEMYMTISKVELMLNDCQNIDFFEFIPCIAQNKYFLEQVKCNECKKNFSLYSLSPVLTENSFELFCPNCIEKMDDIKVCPICGELFKQKNNAKICKICEEKIEA